MSRPRMTGPVIPTKRHGRVADASLPRSAEDEGEEGEGQDDDDDEAAAIGPATIDAALPLLAKGGFLVHGRRVVWAGKAGQALYTIVI